MERESLRNQIENRRIIIANIDKQIKRLKTTIEGYEFRKRKLVAKNILDEEELKKYKEE